MFILLFVVTAIALLSGRAFTVSKAAVDHTTQVLVAIQDVEMSMLNAETGERGYLITGDTAYLAPYSESVAVIYAQLESLYHLVEDCPEQTEKARKVGELINAKLGKLRHVLEARRDRGYDAAKGVLIASRSRDTMDAIRLTLAQMAQREQSLMNQRLLAVDDAALGLVVTLVIVVMRDLIVLVILVHAIQSQDVTNTTEARP